MKCSAPSSQLRCPGGPGVPGPCPEAVGPEAGAALGLRAGRAGRLLSGRREAARAALKWARLISAFKCLQSYSKSSRREGSQPRQPGTGVGRGTAGTQLTPSPCSPRPQAALRGRGVLPCSGRPSPSLTPAAKGCLLQPKANLILSPGCSSLGRGPRPMPPTQHLRSPLGDPRTERAVYAAT